MCTYRIADRLEACDWELTVADTAASGSYGPTFMGAMVWKSIGRLRCSRWALIRTQPLVSWIGCEAMAVEHSESECPGAWRMTAAVDIYSYK